VTNEFVVRLVRHSAANYVVGFSTIGNKAWCTLQLR
jgi:hypothetical protein